MDEEQSEWPIKINQLFQILTRLQQKDWACGEFLRKKKEEITSKRKKIEANSTQCSQAVTHPSTD